MKTPYERAAARLKQINNPRLSRGLCWCKQCGRCEVVDPVHCLSRGWPKCCGYTMTIDSPQERGSAPEATP